MGKVIDLLPFFETAKNRPRVLPEAVSVVTERLLEVDFGTGRAEEELRLLLPQQSAVSAQPEPAQVPLSEAHASEVADLATERARRAVANAQLFGAMGDYDQAA